MGTLAAEGVEYSQRVFWAMELEVDGTIMTGSVAESVRWGGTTRDQTLLKSDWILREILRQIKTSHTLPCFHHKEGENKPS